MGLQVLNLKFEHFESTNTEIPKSKSHNFEFGSLLIYKFDSKSFR